MRLATLEYFNLITDDYTKGRCMSLKLIIPFILLLAAAGCSGDSALKETFTADISKMYDAYNNSRWENVADMYYPKFFLAVRRSQVIGTLRHLDSAGMARRFSLKDIEKITERHIHGDEEFCRIYYNAQIEITLKDSQLENIGHFIEDFNEDYGGENVIYNEKEHKFTISAKQSLIAVSKINSGTWKYLELNNEHAFDIVAQAVPKEIMGILTREE